MKKNKLASVAIVVATIFTQSCNNTPEGHTWAPEAGIQFTVSSSYDVDAELSAFGYTVSGSANVDYDSFDLRIGQTSTSAGDTRAIKHEHIGIIIGTSTFALSDFGSESDSGISGTEISGGGRMYKDKGNDTIPYLSFYSTMTELDAHGIPSSPQIGLRVGGGLEYIIAEGIMLDAGADFLIPLSSGSVGSPDESVDLEWSGLAIRIGIIAGF
jgi:hypothetical protein